MLKFIYILILSNSGLTILLGQDTVKVKSNHDTINANQVEAKVENGDTILHVTLDVITIKPPIKLTSKKEIKQYSRLVLYVKKVYPYSKIVSQQVNEIHAHLEEYDSKREKNEYIKLKEDELKAQFEGELRKLTFTQGRILIKLIDRETGATTYDLVKELKGSLNAFFWQSVARVFGSNLKLEYDPAGEDRMIEDIVVRIENGEL